MSKRIHADHDQASPRAAHHFPLGNGSLSTSGSARNNTCQSLKPDGSYQGDALATVHSGGDDNCLYGGSSTISFVQQFAEVASAGDQAASMGARNSSTQTATQLGSRTRLPRPQIILEPNESASVCPARRKADDYLQCFWEFVHPVFPVIHKTSFIATYEKIWTGEDADDHLDSRTDVEEVVFTSNLNLIFALGCQYSTPIPASQKRSAANDFYQRSRQLFPFDILDSNSMPLVQMLLLMGIYLQSTKTAA